MVRSGERCFHGYGDFGQVIAPDETELDLTQLPEISRILDREQPDLIINPAAYTAVDKAEDEPELALRVNGEGPGVIARWAALRNVPLIHFSTDYVFNGTGDQAWREDDKVQPLSVYGSSKLAGENAVRAAGGISLIIRTSWVYAARGANFLQAIARLARERKELRIVADQIGAPTSAAVIADGVIAMLSPGLINFAPAAPKPTALLISWRRAKPAGMALRQQLSMVSGSGTSRLRLNTFGRSRAQNIPLGDPSA